MKKLPHSHVMTLELDVDFGRTTHIGRISAGHRGIAAVLGGTFEGERLRGSVAPGADWFVIEPDGTLSIDVRLTLTTFDNVPIYLRYQGSMRGKGDAMARFAKRELLDPADYNLVINAEMECGDSRYSWLNGLPIVGCGTQTATGPIYELYQIGHRHDL